MAGKIMISRYAGKCRKCGNAIPAGERVQWQGKGRGVIHYPSCQKSEPEAKQKTQDGRLVQFPFGELREAYMNPNFRHARPSNNSRLDECKRIHWADASWAGCSIAEMQGYLQNGYKVEQLGSPPTDLLPKRKRRRLLFTEDGEVQVDLALSGFDYPFLEWEKRERKPGMRVNIGLAFSCGTDTAVVAAYETWCARMLYTLEEIGYDLEINVSVPVTSMSNQSNERTDVLLKVKGENEASDFTQWSALFSPGGFRHLGILSMQLASDKLGEDCTGFHGYPVKDEWGIEFDSDQRTMKVQCSSGSSQFPEAMMTERFTQIMSGQSG